MIRKRNRYKKTHKKSAKKDVSLIWRAGARIFSVGAIFTTVLYGITAGGYITDTGSPLYNVQGQIAAYFGYAAKEIRISGLERQSPKAVLRAINVVSDASLIGFDAGQARSKLYGLDWVKKAKVRRLYPNQLEIEIVERRPFAIWQRDGEFYVIDKFGAAFTSIDAREVKNLLVVTGEGAHKKVFDLVNHLEAHLRLKSQIVAAGRIGNRRWNLYLKNGLKVMLPADGTSENLATGLVRLMELDRDVGIFEKAVAGVDLRFDDRVLILPLKNVGKLLAAK